MSKQQKEESIEWKYEGNEDEWDSFDRRMIRHMRKKLDTLGTKLWLGRIGSVFSMNQNEYEMHCGDVMKANTAWMPVKLEN